jgi:hypothetical protein
MTKISRRNFLATAACAVAATRLHAQMRGDGKATVTLAGQASGPHMPADFVGLSYEVQQLVDPSFFSPVNSGLIRAFKELSANGVLRLGGNTSEFAYWRPTRRSPEPKHPKTRVVEGEPKPIYYPVTEKAVRNLAAFLQATGWTCLYGIGMGTNTPERAAAEAEFVAKTLGSSLHYFQIGNEVDLFDRHLRDPQTWNAKAYLDEWLKLARAITERVPNAVFGIPDVAANVSWLPEIAELWPSIQNPPRVSTLTHHYYFGGPATNPDVNIPNLLRPATMARVQKTADTATGAARKVGARVRMTEGNTCYRGGKPGVSDVFAAALWSADYSLLLASNNYSGINLHGGTGRSVANSVGGVLPGDTMLQQQGQTPAQIASHPHPFYTPIGTFGTNYVLEPVAYGLRFAGLLSGGTFMAGDFADRLQDSGVNATGYATKMPNGDISVILLNKDLDRDLEATVNFGEGKSGIVEVENLHAPAVDSREAQINSIGAAGSLRDSSYKITVRKSSGVRLTLKA